MLLTALIRALTDVTILLDHLHRGVSVGSLVLEPLEEMALNLLPSLLLVVLPPGSVCTSAVIRPPAPVEAAVQAEHQGADHGEELEEHEPAAWSGHVEDGLVATYPARDGRICDSRACRMIRYD